DIPGAPIANAVDGGECGGAHGPLAVFVIAETHRGTAILVHFHGEMRRRLGTTKKIGYWLPQLSRTAGEVDQQRDGRFRLADGAGQVSPRREDSGESRVSRVMVIAHRVRLALHGQRAFAEPEAKYPVRRNWCLGL